MNLLNQGEPNRDASYVLYWAQMNRRVASNHGLAYAAELANEHRLPLLYYEGLTCDYPKANRRLHTFILEGVPDTARELARLGIGYTFYLRRKRSDANNVFYRLAEKAAAVVTDDYPVFIAREFNKRVPAKLKVPYYTVDSSCIVPMNLFEKREYAAYTIRPKINRWLPEFLEPAPKPKVKVRWSGPGPGPHTEVTADNIAKLVSECEVDQSVPPSLSYRGGAGEAQRHFKHFLEHSLRRYARERNEPSKHATSSLSPYLHFGHINALDVALGAREYAAEHKLVADEFLEELIVRRELAFNHALFSDKPAALESVPGWAQEDLRRHASDPRPEVYTREEFERAETGDDLWNATQKELLLRGKIHGYYRMYWGKKIIEWSATAEEALETMVDLHDRYALDGRDPNTYTNILWCFGLHDRPWFERPIFGKIRYMARSGMERKTDTAAYLKEIAYMEQTGVDPFRLK